MSVSALLDRLFLHPSEHPWLIDTERAHRYGALRDQLTQCRSQWPDLAGHKVGLVCGPLQQMLPSLLALHQVGAWPFLLDPATASPTALAESEGWVGWISSIDNQFHPLAEQTPHTAHRQNLTFYTSGSTGRPKAVTHQWSRMVAPAKIEPHYATTRWLMSYPGWLYAGLQVIMQVLLNGATLVVPDSTEPHLLAQTMADKAVTHASGTPTFWRRLLVFGQGSVWHQSLQQITLGGEAVDQPLLTGLRERVGEGVRITHIFATSEHGRCFSVSDGLAGFPVAFLQQDEVDGVSLELREERLWIRPKHGMLGYESAQDVMEEGWRPTGDRVVIEKERVLFLGREGDLLNVGGHKVWPEQVEAKLRAVWGVVELRLYGHPSQLTGVIPALEVVAAPNIETAELEKRLRQTGQRQLAPYERPRLFKFVSQLSTRSSGKMQRSQ
uniref:Long-chain-fatty-acid--CoA ligase n=1 Tax=Magnetococcus massalia (strain MO-1) TaxID=451514 RepID=A0A1S7LPQ9_MAGMO|nr:putative AMP-dependent synthetase/ligase [Candidatus Magnetococcus massalia]